MGFSVVLVLFVGLFRCCGSLWFLLFVDVGLGGVFDLLWGFVCCMIVLGLAVVCFGL